MYEWNGVIFPFMFQRKEEKTSVKCPYDTDISVERKMFAQSLIQETGNAWW